MSKLFKSLIMGAIVGILEVCLMTFQNADLYSNISTLIHWIVLGFLINYVNLNIKPWLKGILLAEITALPIVALLLKSEPVSGVPILVLSAVFGAILGIWGDKYAK
ncbi:hypothetical protein LY28_01720 [Ruminiclostridium sufflavum DSM 19573]|uniref:Uncharacterized protein n=1 Tax=Ruminiclostridium sufflavum DSM 19573 TaxID=1121337 RepID=A0A318XKN4_9FIRM|nr:hypothetical protein [Ruminiclostridium sufflavum]PYG88010.1 hypothetical protein LY28_01720 [Ruminiclostridium sufflavum DSM 19573]